MEILAERRRRLRFSTHANQRLSERGILRRWVVAATTTRPTCIGRHQIYVLSVDELNRRFGVTLNRGLRVVVDRSRAVVVTAHWQAEKG